MRRHHNARRLVTLLLAAPALVGCEDPVVKSWEYVASSAIQSTPAITPDRIIFGSDSGDVSAVTRNGEFIWKYATRREVVGAIRVADDMVLFGSTNNSFYALDLMGRELWKYTTLGRIKGDPLVVGKTVYFGSYDKSVYALSTTRGTRVWNYPGSVLAPAPAQAETAPVEGAASSGGVAAKAAPGAPGPASAPAAAPVEDKVEPGDFAYSSPVKVGTNIILGNLDGHLYALDAETGRLSWRFKIDGADAKKGVTSTPLEVRDGIVFGGNDGNVYSISKDGQKVNWKFKTGDEVNATPVADEDGNLYVGGVDRTFYALDGSGKERWRFSTKGAVMGRAALMSNLVIFAGGSGDGTVYAVDRGTGKLFWSYTTQDKIEGDLLVEGNRAYVGSGDKRLYCFQFNKTSAGK
jgi:outer membrane protein assembly factor BamB